VLIKEDDSTGIGTLTLYKPWVLWET
jgi:hypothetical protein